MPLPSFRTMSRDELRDYFEAVCRMFAMRHSQRTGAALAEQHRYADRHWRTFREMALDFIAIAEADAEARAAAPWN